MGRTLMEIMADKVEPDFARLDTTTEADIALQMIEDGEDPTAPLPGNAFLGPRKVRALYGMSQPEFAHLLKVPVSTVRNWEQGRGAMDHSTRTLYRILSAEPEAVRRALERQPEDTAARVA